jgi:hypothetical protein
VRAVKPLDANMVYRGPKPGILDLECTRVKPGHIRSVWRLTDDERRYIAAGGLIQLDVLTEPIPPVSLNVTEPHCPECIVAMNLEWRDSVWHFRCPGCKRWAQ